MPPRGLVVDEADDRPPEGHQLDRQGAVPADEQLVDQDVGPLVRLPRLGVAQALDELELDRQAFRRSRSTAASTCSVPLTPRWLGACTILGVAGNGAGSRGRHSPGSTLA